ncbi:MAG: peptidylprolyl isomerase [Planctomycetes bacterium]|nr:peptidylprolyl isomerase [Planctomycetota bacterium]
MNPRTMQITRSFLAALLLVPVLVAQDPGARRPGRSAPPPVIGEDPTPPAPQQEAAPIGAQTPPGGQIQLFGEGVPGASGDPFGAGLQADDPRQPRVPGPGLAPPFGADRAVLLVDGIELRTAELNQLVDYYRGFRPGSTDLLLRDAVRALVPKKVCEAAYSRDLAAMSSKIAAAKEAAEDGADFARIAAKYSDDDEAPTADARYTFGREVAVQPFDRLSHSGRLGEIQGPFLTKYGYHFLEILEYHRGAEAKDDRSTVRHVLVMYPALKDAEDARSLIQRRVAECRIQVLDPAVRNLVPPELRDRLAD